MPLVACGALAYAVGLLAALSTPLHTAVATAPLGTAAATSWRAELETPAAGNGMARATIHDGSCHVRASLLLASGHGEPGEVASVRGDASLDARGLVVSRARLSDVRRPRSAAALRARV